MPQATLACQLDDPGTGDSSRISLPGQRNHSHQTAPDASHWTPVRGDDQELAATASRRTGPRRWLRAVTWLISTGLHSKANATTQRLAEDLITRMDFDTGHAVYDLEGTAARLGVDKATVKRHARYLRELGALVWVSHGTQRNSRRARGLEGYAGTATIYAATIPAAYDHAMGNTVIGEGYEARIIIDQRGQTPVENQDRAPLSLTGVKEVGQVQVVGGVTTTGGAAANSTTPPTQKASKKRATILGAKVTAAGAQLADQLAQTLRSRFPWLRRATHDQVRWICADMGEQQWTVQEAVQFASNTAAIQGRDAGLRWQPERPHALLAAGLRDHEQQRLENDRRATGHAQEMTPMSNEAWEALWAAQRTTPTASPRTEPQHTDDERRTARMYGWQDFGMVADHYDDNPDDALDLYGTKLCTVAIRQTSRQETYA